MRVCLFAGTTEGRRVAELLQEEPALLLTVCVATEYGEIVLEQIRNIKIRTGRMDGDEMKRFFSENAFRMVVDATHPYAEAATKNIRSAAKACGIEYLRVLREGISGDGKGETFALNGDMKEESCFDREEKGLSCRSRSKELYFHSAEKAAAYLAGKEGNILLTTGVKELPCFRQISRDRIWARVLPSVSSIEACDDEGIRPSHIIAMQGPFSKNANKSLLEDTGAAYLVTKDSGHAGGFPEKLEAAAECGVVSIVIGHSQEQQGMGVEEAAEYIRGFLQDSRLDGLSVPSAGKGKIQVKIVSMGAGGGRCLTLEARDAIREAEVLVGAERMLADYPHKRRVFEISPQKIRNYIEKTILDPDSPDRGKGTNYAILVGGDAGFYSAARGIMETLGSLGECEVSCIPGVGCVSYFTAKLGIPWEDCVLMSLHGRDQNLLYQVSMQPKVITLTGGGNTVKAVCRKLTDYGYGGVKVTVGERLSYPEERIVSGKAEELADQEFDALSVMLIENEKIRKLPVGIPDDVFIRGIKIPMTKREVRAVTLSYLNLSPESIVYDIGAGTGSVSVECARAAFRGKVYAVEKDREAVELLQENRRKFAVDNLIPVPGSAPEALAGLEPPTHVFIGGSAGNLRSIMGAVLRKNPDAEIVMNTVTLETLAEAVSCAGEFGFDATQYAEIGVSHGKPVGRYHLMTAQNPVTVIRFARGQE